MNEERFAYHVRQKLNCSLDDVSPGVLRRLEASRHHALTHQKREVPERVLAFDAIGPFGMSARFDEGRLRQWMGMALLLFVIVFAVYWQGHLYVEDIENTDSALLADDIPPDAFLDNGFAAWLDNSSQE